MTNEAQSTKTPHRKGLKAVLAYRMPDGSEDLFASARPRESGIGVAVWKCCTDADLPRGDNRRDYFGGMPRRNAMGTRGNNVARNHQEPTQVAVGQFAAARVVTYVSVAAQPNLGTRCGRAFFSTRACDHDDCRKAGPGPDSGGRDNCRLCRKAPSACLQLSKDPNNGPNEFAVPIESDPGLTGQVLKFVNSSYFGFSREISSVKTAITLVGVRTIKNFALWSAVFSLMPNPKCGPFDLKHLWQDSLRRALFARAVAKLLGLREAEDAFAAALLQDMAVPLLAKEFPTEYLKLLEGAAKACGFRTWSGQTFGWTHAEIGGQMARKWKLPEDTAQLIERHTAIDELDRRPKSPIRPKWPWPFVAVAHRRATSTGPSAACS